ncbi:MAG: hypothetical protein IJ048_01255 [Clostridia bacterium]|nr:hypothetical protein [Clostridia bacterium]
MELYKDEDYQAAKRGMLRRFGVIALILALTVALLILFVTTWRNEILAMLVCALGAAVIFFYLNMKLLPWFYYWRYQTDMRHGREHVIDCRFVSLSEGSRLSDGVAFREFIVTLNQPEMKKENGEKLDNERMLLWDADKQAPALKPDQPLHIRAFGNYIIALEAES